VRYPDNPNLIDADFLARLDAQEPGRWIAQVKYNGFRRLATLTGNEWTWQAKHTSGPAAQKMPDPLIADWLCFTAPLIGKHNVVIDCEWVGPRGGFPHQICMFDLLEWDGQWLGKTPFVDRYAALAKVYDELLKEVPGVPCRIALVQAWDNPGLVFRFMEQMQDERSEGLVIRRADSGLVGSHKECKDNPFWFKVRRQPINRVLQHMKRKEGEE
jgi:ATP-dependent DNA ligase